MKTLLSTITAAACLIASLVIAPSAFADEDSYASAETNFKKAAETRELFDTAYGYALFPTIGKGGIGIGAAYGKGRVYQGGNYVGDSSLSQVSIGFQLGGQAYSEIIFFKDAKAFEDFTSGSFEFDATASAVAINVGASAKTGTTGNSAGAGQAGSNHNTVGKYVNGMAVYTAAKGGLMFEAALAGQSFTFDAKKN